GWTGAWPTPGAALGSPAWVTSRRTAPRTTPPARISGGPAWGCSRSSSSGRTGTRSTSTFPACGPPSWPPSRTTAGSWPSTRTPRWSGTGRTGRSWGRAAPRSWRTAGGRSSRPGRGSPLIWSTIRLVGSGKGAMIELYELHRRAGDLLATTIGEVRADQWHLPTPCSEWDVRDLVHHIAWTNLWVAPLCDGRDLSEVAPTLEGDVLGDDPIGVAVRSLDEASAGFERAGNATIVQLS